MDYDQSLRPVPQQRIREKVDACMSRRDTAGAERVLSYWLTEAIDGHDLRGQLMIRSEMVGLYRKTGDRKRAYESAGEALRLIRELAYENSLSAATVWINIATAYTAFGDHASALPLFEQARAVYEAHPGTEDALLGGLYNNMGQTLTALGRYKDAMTLYHQALERMSGIADGAPEAAITCLNMADTLASAYGMEAAESRINTLLDQAESLLLDPARTKDGNYAFVCDKCAPVFEYYGYFLTADRLKKESEAIYERNGAGQELL